jgi:hypothetical protein
MYAVQLMELPRALDSLSVFDAAIRQASILRPVGCFQRPGAIETFYG